MAFHKTINKIAYGSELSSAEINSILNAIHENTLDLEKTISLFDEKFKSHGHKIDDINGLPELIQELFDSTLKRKPSGNLGACVLGASYLGA